LPEHPALEAHARKLSLQDRCADRITAFAGSMRFVYLHVGWFLLWVLAQPFGDHFPFGLLTMLVSLEAIFLSTFVMLSQNRADQKRSALAEHTHETTLASQRLLEALLQEIQQRGTPEEGT